MIVKVDFGTGFIVPYKSNGRPKKKDLNVLMLFLYRTTRIQKS